MTEELPNASWSFIDGLSVDMEKILGRSQWAVNYVITKNSLSNEKLASESGMSTASIDGYRRGVRAPKVEFVLFLEKKYGLNTEWYLYGRGEPFPGVRKIYPDVCGPETSEFVTVPARPDFPVDEFVFVRQVNGRISAGNGLAPDDTADMFCAFRKDWMKRKGGKASSMSLIKVSGDSMEPTLLDGDLVMVDHSRTAIAPQGGIYAIWIKGQIMIKRLQLLFDQNKIRILSDNSHYEAIDADADQVKINGKVIWFGREMEK